jgi:four helix bundle protein
MDNSDWLNYKIQVRDRLRAFALKILELSEMFPTSQRGRVINNQLTRSGSSTYANYRAALRGRSKAEFFAKLSIAVEEADETEMWLDLCISSVIIKSDFVKEIHKESLELLKILASMRKTISK